MPSRIYPLNKIRYWYAYTIDEICEMYEDKNLHPQTVRKWVKNGLSIIEYGKSPMLIYGHDLKAFIGQRNRDNKCQTSFDQMFCLKCQDAKPIYQKEVTTEQLQNGCLRLTGQCRTCKTTMNKNYKFEDSPKIKRTFVLADVLELYDRENTSPKTHFQENNQHGENESDQGELFICLTNQNIMPKTNA